MGARSPEISRLASRGAISRGVGNFGRERAHALNILHIERSEKTVWFKFWTILVTGIIAGAFFIYWAAIALPPFADSNVKKNRAGESSFDRLGAAISGDAVFVATSMIAVLVFAGAMHLRSWQIYDRICATTGMYVAVTRADALGRIRVYQLTAPMIAAFSVALGMVVLFFTAIERVNIGAGIAALFWSALIASVASDGADVPAGVSDLLRNARNANRREEIRRAREYWGYRPARRSSYVAHAAMVAGVSMVSGSLVCGAVLGLGGPAVRVGGMDVVSAGFFCCVLVAILTCALLFCCFQVAVGVAVRDPVTVVFGVCFFVLAFLFGWAASAGVSAGAGSWALVCGSTVAVWVAALLFVSQVFSFRIWSRTGGWRYSPVGGGAAKALDRKAALYSGREIPRPQPKRLKLWYLRASGQCGGSVAE